MESEVRDLKGSWTSHDQSPPSPFPDRLEKSRGRTLLLVLFNTETPVKSRVEVRTTTDPSSRPLDSPTLDGDVWVRCSLRPSWSSKTLPSMKTRSTIPFPVLTPTLSKNILDLHGISSRGPSVRGRMCPGKHVCGQGDLSYGVTKPSGPLECKSNI